MTAPTDRYWLHFGATGPLTCIAIGCPNPATVATLWCDGHGDDA